MPKFKLLQGTHSDNHPSDGRNRIYRPGDIIETKSDLSKLNHPEKVDKFQKVSDDTPSSPGFDSGNPTNSAPAATQSPPSAPQSPAKSATDSGTYESMSVQDLITFANAEEIDISKVKKDKPSLIAAIKAAGG